MPMKIHSDCTNSNHACKDHSYTRLAEKIGKQEIIENIPKSLTPTQGIQYNFKTRT